jgi:hypothetical protein
VSPTTQILRGFALQAIAVFIVVGILCMASLLTRRAERQLS